MFILTKRVEKVLDQMKTLESETAKLQLTVSKLEDLVVTLNCSYNDLANKVKQLKKLGG